MKNPSKQILCLATAASALFFAGISKAATLKIYHSNKVSASWKANNWDSTIIGSGNPVRVKYVVDLGDAMQADLSVGGIDTLEVFGNLITQNKIIITINANGIVLVWASSSSTAGTIQQGTGNTIFRFVGACQDIVGPFSGTNQVFGDSYADAITACTYGTEPKDAFVDLSLLAVPTSTINVVKAGDNYEVSWTAQGESNRHDFSIAISENGNDFSLLVAIPGNGETGEGNYTYSLGVREKAFYLRLIETDLNGVKTTLVTRYVKTSADQAYVFQLSPTLLASGLDNMKLILPAAGSYKLTAYDMTTAVSASCSVSTFTENEAIDIPASSLGLRPGNYVVVLTGDKEEVYKTRITVY